MFDINFWKGLIVPFLYITILVGSLITFSSIYRKRQEGDFRFTKEISNLKLMVNTAKSANLAPWFPPHLQRNIYFSLTHLEQPEDEKGIRVPESVIRAALMRRAVEDIYRIIQVRTTKQALSTLLQRGSVGDDLWQRHQRAEKEIEEELRDVVMEVRN